MSLDVYLRKPADNFQGLGGKPRYGVIFVRENGAMREISREEWDAKYPDREPITIDIVPDDRELFSANITHNLNTMAGEAGIYEALWRPEEMIAPEIAARLHISEKEKGYHHEDTKAIEAEFPTPHARDLIEPLRAGLALMKSDPSRFEKLNPSNGWGSYDVFVPWIERYLEACEENPDAEVEVSR